MIARRHIVMFRLHLKMHFCVVIELSKYGEDGVRVSGVHGEPSNYVGV